MMTTAFAAYVAGALRLEHLTYIDVGCSGGIDPVWRMFGEKLRVLALDASIDECNRLASLETHPDIHYLAGFVGIPADHPFAIKAANRPRLLRNPFPRFCAGRMRALNDARLQTASLGEKLQHNAWDLTQIADPSKPVIVPDEIDRLGWTDVDILKIDIDGPDFDVLNSFDAHLGRLGVIAASLEVNLYGSPGDVEHSFHNTDRFMCAQGFVLARLDVRTYAMSAMPAPFAITMPAQNISGRAFQAEAYYVRDPVATDMPPLELSPSKLVKLSAILSMWNQPDGAAEILLTFRERVGELIDVDLSLELLAGQSQAQAGWSSAMSYKEYVGAFEANDPSFYPS